MRTDLPNNTPGYPSNDTRRGVLEILSRYQDMIRNDVPSPPRTYYNSTNGISSLSCIVDNMHQFVSKLDVRLHIDHLAPTTPGGDPIEVRYLEINHSVDGLPKIIPDDGSVMFRILARYAEHELAGEKSTRDLEAWKDRLPKA